MTQISKESLKDKTDKELREIIKGIEEERRKAKKEYDEAIREVWDKRNKLDSLKAKVFKMKSIRGKRKGKECPALSKMKRAETRYYYYSPRYKCEARNCYNPTARTLEDMFARFCSTCRLTHEKAKDKVTWKRVFEKG